MTPDPDIFTALAAGIGGSVCAILAMRQPPHLPNVRPVERDILALRQAAERRRRNRRILWIDIILAGVLFLLALALTDTASAAPLGDPQPPAKAYNPYYYGVCNSRDHCITFFLPRPAGRIVDRALRIMRVTPPPPSSGKLP